MWHFFTSLMIMSCKHGQNPYFGYIETIFLQSKSYNEAFNEAEWIFPPTPNRFNDPTSESLVQRIKMTKLSAKNELYFRVS